MLMKTYNKKDFKPKKKDAWSVFKIMGEFVMAMNNSVQLVLVSPFLVQREQNQITPTTLLALT